MSLTEEKATRGILAQVRELLDEREAPERAAMLGEFASAYLRRSTIGFDSERDAEALLREVSGAFDLASGRGGAPIAVRAFNPVRSEHGYEAVGSVLEASTADLPFLVDSVSEELRARGLAVRRVLHPIVGVERDAAGRIVGLEHPRDAPERESVMHFELDARLSPEALAALEDGVRRVLGDVQRAVRDYPAMDGRIGRMIELARAAGAVYAEDEIEETVAFLEWLRRDNFIFLGYREYDLAEETLSVARGSGLGLLADESTSAFARPVPLGTLTPELRARVLEGELLVLSETNRLSPVHRRERMGYLGLRRVDAEGAVVGEARMLGLLTRTAYAEAARHTPLLRRKLRRILDAEDLIEGSHDYKDAVTLFESFPKDELFTAATDDLCRAVIALLGRQGDEVRLLGRRAADGRSVSLIVALSRSRSTPRLLDRLTALFERRLPTASVDVHEVLGEGDRVHLHFTAHADSRELPDVSFAELESEVIALAHTWDDAARDLLVARHGEERGRMLAARWLERLPESYKAAADPVLAVEDVAGFERLVRGSEPFVVGLQNEPGDEGAHTRVGLYKSGRKVELSEVMPLLEDLGLRVVEEVPTRLVGDDELWLQDFGVLGPGDRPLDLDAVGDRVEACITAVMRGEAESDSLNRLVVGAGVDWGQVEVLRAYRKYRQRIGSRFTEGYQNDVIAANGHITAKLIRLFALRFDPDEAAGEEAQAVLRAAIVSDLDEVASLDHDRILRNQLGLIEATVRTNVYRPGRQVIAFKLSSARVPAIPQPAPLFEIYVYSPDVEGIHLRGGRIARGGIRWSDRMDYRTEVFGLMRAQMTKNAVIVPSGAKGGFFLRRAPQHPAALREEVERRYVDYIGGLLDLTDNLVDGEVVHPEGVRVLDEDDTYLVVAADKGTATFSDTANAISMRAGFWLGDAFASGGQTGYDHKQLGITARGAWESVKRHFAELDVDPAVEEFTAVGIGDMSGDVFGNGMLISDRVRLVAAYDHRHVFIDPEPDAAASHAERRRLFELPRSSWADYDAERISAGGGVWPRTAKSIALSPQAREALGTEEEHLPPAEVIRAILRAPVDLLWNGGIGTVVKAAAESDDDALDRSSDAIRVDAADLRCRVVGEGGNLGFTARARIEYDAAGGRVNADFIDNSAGVDCSDHEVNLKVMLDVAVRRGELESDDRDALLAEVTAHVVDHVLYDAFLQAQIIAQEARVSATRLYAYEDLMSALEADGVLDRALEALPGTEEMADRRRAGAGMHRPELAVLLASAKRRLTDALLDSALPDDPHLDADLRAYFPAPVVERFGHLLDEHPLRRELVSTLVANEIVNSLGPTFVWRLMAERGAEPAAVVRAYRIAREVTGAVERWNRVEQLGRGVDREAQWELMAAVDGLVEAVARWYLGHRPGADLGTAIATGGEGFARLVAAGLSLGVEEWRSEREAAAGELRERGVPAELAEAHALLPALVHAPDVTVVAEATERTIEDVGRAFFLLGDGLRLAWLDRRLDELPANTRMQRWAAQAVRDDLVDARRELAQRALADGDGASVEEAVAGFLDARRDTGRRLSGFMRGLAIEGGVDLAGLTLAVRKLRALVD